MNNYEIVKRMRACIKDLNEIDLYSSDYEDKKILYFNATDKAANILLNTIGIKEFPVSVDTITEYLGINVSKRTFKSIEENKRHVDSLIKCFSKRKDNTKNDVDVQIIINQDDTIEINRTSTMYSISVFIWEYKDTYDEFFSGIVASEERDILSKIPLIKFIHNCFAINILIPTEVILKLKFFYELRGYEEKKYIKILAKVFNVEEEDIINKLKLINKYYFFRS